MHRSPVITMVVNLAVALVAVAGPVSGRTSISLDGEWNFKLLAPRPPPRPMEDLNNGAAQEELLLLAVGTIGVPGSWEAQGYGTETVQMHWQVLTGENARSIPPAPSPRPPAPPLASAPTTTTTTFCAHSCTPHHHKASFSAPFYPGTLFTLVQSPKFLAPAASIARRWRCRAARAPSTSQSSPSTAASTATPPSRSAAGTTASTWDT